MYLYRIHTKSHSDPSPDWISSLYARGLCPRCRIPDSKMFAAGIDVVLNNTPDISAINRVSPPGINIARKDFLAMFKDEFKGYLRLGRVLNLSGEELENYVSFLTEKPLLIRGSEKSILNKCTGCERMLYSPRMEHYVLQKYLTGRSFYCSIPLGGIIITPELRKRIEPGRWKGMCALSKPHLRAAAADRDNREP